MAPFDRKSLLGAVSILDGKLRGKGFEKLPVFPLTLLAFFLIRFFLDN
jgi:hypothetical protein